MSQYIRLCFIALRKPVSCILSYYKRRRFCCLVSEWMSFKYWYHSFCSPEYHPHGCLCEPRNHLCACIIFEIPHLSLQSSVQFHLKYQGRASHHQGGDFWSGTHHLIGSVTSLTASRENNWAAQDYLLSKLPPECPLTARAAGVSQVVVRDCWSCLKEEDEFCVWFCTQRTSFPECKAGTLSGSSLDAWVMQWMSVWSYPQCPLSLSLSSPTWFPFLCSLSSQSMSAHRGTLGLHSVHFKE